MLLTAARGNERDREDQSVRELIDTIDTMIKKEERSLDELLKTFDEMGFEAPEVKLPERKPLILPTPEETRKLQQKKTSKEGPGLLSFFRKKENKQPEEKVVPIPDIKIDVEPEEKAEPEKKKRRGVFSFFGKNRDKDPSDDATDVTEPPEE
ncbi:MAG: hypothetical protein AAF492_27465, partial [Verrucomicrobiota bacterium]